MVTIINENKKMIEGSGSAMVTLRAEPLLSLFALPWSASNVTEKDWNLLFLFFYCHVIARRGTRPRWLAPTNRLLLLEVGRYFCYLRGYVRHCSSQIKYCYERSTCQTFVSTYNEIEGNHMTQSNDLHGTLHLQASRVFILTLSSFPRIFSQALFIHIL